MNFRHILATSVAALALVSTPALHATSIHIGSPVHAMFSKDKMVKVSFRNDSGSDIELKAGDTVTKIQSGSTISMKLPQGTKVLTNTATPKLAAGTVVTEIASYLDGATLSIH